jgi:hypothetical protein
MGRSGVIRVHALDNPFSRKIKVFEMEAGVSASIAVARVWDAVGWAPGENVVASIRSGRLTGDQVDLELADETDLILFPAPGAGVTVGAVVVQIIIALVAAAISYLLAPKPKAAPQDRGEDTSPTYQFEIATEYRAGLVIPVVLGEHDIGGTMISTQVRSLTATSGPSRMGVEHVFAILVLAQGPINAIGGVKNSLNRLGGISGMFPKGGTLPSNIRVNGNRMDPTAKFPGIVAYTRLGNVNQSAIPDFPANAATTELVNEFLDGKGDEAIYTISNPSSLPIKELQIIVFFPGGCFYLDGNAAAQQFVCKIRVDWRKVGATLWTRLFPSPTGEVDLGKFNTARTRQPYAVTLTGTFLPSGVPTTGIEVRVQRTTATNEGGISSASSSLKWRQVVYQVEGDLEYPGSAVFGMILETGESIGGSRANYVNRVQGSLVRVWDRSINAGLPSGYWEDGLMVSAPRAGAGWYWDVPTDAYGAIWSYPPGQNPAWLAVELLTNQRWGLGRWITDDQVDWQAFRDWADWCDRSILTGSVNEAGQQCDFVLDASTPAWEALIRICSTGRAVPCLLGNKYSVRYNYDAAHGRGTNVVPKKAAVQLFTSANVRDLQVLFRNPRSRPAVYVLQILNRDKDYTHETMSVDDPDGEFNDPASSTALQFRKETREAFGVTRRSQAIRDTLFDHKANYLIRSEVSFVAGPESLAATLGDLILVQHDWLRPYDTNANGWRTFQASSGAAIYLDHAVTLLSSVQYSVSFKEKDGTLGTVRVVTSTAGAFGVGTAIPLVNPINVKKGAVCVFGVEDEITKTYEIRSISLQQDLTRRVVAHEHYPEVHADPNVGANLEFGGPDGDESPYVPAQSNQTDDNNQDFPVPLGVLVRRTQVQGQHEVSYTGDPTFSSRPCRIYLRAAGESVTDEEQVALLLPAYADASLDGGAVPTDIAIGWTLLGETAAGGTLLTQGLISTQKYDFSLTQPSLLGAWPPPDLGQIVSDVTIDEFPIDQPKPPTHLYVQQTHEGNLLQWEHAESADVMYYEVRETDATTVRWLGAQVVARTTQQFVTVPPAMGTKYAVRARSRWGQWSELATIAAPAGAPQNELDSGATFGAWTAVDLDGSAGAGYSLSATKWYGTATATLTLGYTAEARVLVRVHSYWEDIKTTLEDLDFTTDSGEAVWWLLEGREASPDQPGCNFEIGLDDAAFVGRTLDDPIFEDMTVGGTKGQVGDHAAVKIFANYDSGGWEPYQPRRRVFNSVQIQLRLYRVSDQYQVYTGALTALAYVR